jgi:hypothetical protein
VSAHAKKHDPRDRTADGDPREARKGNELTSDELLGKGSPMPAPPSAGTTQHRAPAKRCGGCRKELAITDTFCPACVPHGASVPTFGGANPPDPDSVRTLAMGLPVKR